MPLEKDARVKIDRMLAQAGWTVVDYEEVRDLFGGNLAVREFPLTIGGADYLLIVDGEAVGVLEAKRAGTPLSGAKEQSARYQSSRPAQVTWVRFLRDPLPFSYEATDREIWFTNELEPDPRSRLVFHFHQPQTLAGWLRAAPAGVPGPQTDLLRARLRRMPELPPENLRACQYRAITSLEESFAANRPRALIQMATGSGKTTMAVNSIYRLIKFAGARRVLFLVDRTNLARQTLNQFQQYLPPDTNYKFTQLYNVQHLQDNVFDSTSEVCITTIQRLYSILTGQPLENEQEEESQFEKADQGQQEGRPRVVSYNPAVPIEYFDVIFIDECHRSIYSEWRPVLEYFDAFLVGLTATPESRAFAFFKRNLICEYLQSQAVADGVNVDYVLYRLRTQITQQGSIVERGNVLVYRNKQTRARTYETLEDDLIYEGRHLDREVVAEDQIRTVLRAYKYALFTELFPGRTTVPKTLIFAKNDTHAEDIVRMVREVFDAGNDFVQKITYRVYGARPEELINRFRVNYNPRIVVSVDMISTGTDIKPLEVLFFMRSIRSRTLFEQMKGRGCRAISVDELHTITPDAESKAYFVLFDAVGVTEGLQTDNPPLERKPTVPLEILLERVARGEAEEDELVSLAGRLARYSRFATDEDKAEITRLSGGTLADLAENLLRAADYDQQVARAREMTGLADPPASAVDAAAQQLRQEASQPFSSPNLRGLVLLLRSRDKQAIDDVSPDHVLFQDFDRERAQQEITSFRALMEQNRDTIELFELALQPRPAGTSLAESVQSLARDIKIPTMGLSPDGIDRIWRAYQQLESSRVRGAGTRRLLTDIIALIRYTMERETDSSAILEPFEDQVNRRFEQWLAEQERLRRQPFTENQRWWLDRIRERVITDLQCNRSDLDRDPGFSKGGLRGAIDTFGGEQELTTILRDLNKRLVA